MISEIDSAKVVALFEFKDQEVEIFDTRIEGLAICKYDTDPGYYLFYCDHNWETVTDLYFDSIEQAKEGAVYEFELENMNWKIVD